MTVAAQPLEDDVPGNIGLVRHPLEVVRLTLHERDGVMPSDVAGGLKDLAPPAAHDAPASVSSWTGLGREFVPAGPTALIAVDQDDADTLVTRDCTIQALLTLNLAAASGVMTLFCRGIGGSTSEYYAAGLELENQGGANHGKIDVRWFWATAAGTLKTQTAATFMWPGDGVPFLLTATRRWVSSTEVVIRYFVDEQLVSEVTSVDGDIGGGTTGTTSIGARRTSGTWGRYFSGTIDQLQVIAAEVSPEEIAATWARLAIHQPDGVARMAALSPPGAPWFTDRGSRIARLGKCVGQLLALPAALAEQLRANWLPDRADADTLARWEALLGLAPKARDSLDVRRTRVVAFLRRDNGYSVPQIQAALSGPFDLDAEDVELIEFTPTVTDGFATLETERWHLEPAAARWSIVSGRLRLSALSADAARWDESYREPVHARTALYVASGGVPERQAAARRGCIVQVKMDNISTVPSETLVGLMLYSFVSGDALWFGILNDGGYWKLGYRSFVSGVASSFTEMENFGPSDPTSYLRATSSSTVDGTWTLEFLASSFDGAALFSATVALGAAFEPDYAALAAYKDDTSFGANFSADFDDFLARSPQSERAYAWYAYRDPGDPGAPDMIGANKTVRKLRPAHTHAAAISSRSLLCDDEGSGCDLGPMGAL